MRTRTCEKRVTGKQPLETNMSYFQVTCYRNGVISCVNKVIVIRDLKLGSHMSPIVGDLLSVIIEGKNSQSQRISLMSNHRQWTSPMSATHENQA